MENGYATANKSCSQERPKIDKVTLDQMRARHARAKEMEIGKGAYCKEDDNFGNVI
jgi:hypothetical protein